MCVKIPFLLCELQRCLQVVGRNNGEDTLAHWPTSSGMMSIEAASFEILKYLNKIWGTLSSAGLLTNFLVLTLCAIFARLLYPTKP